MKEFCTFNSTHLTFLTRPDIILLGVVLVVAFSLLCHWMSLIIMLHGHVISPMWTCNLWLWSSRLSMGNLSSLLTCWAKRLSVKDAHSYMLIYKLSNPCDFKCNRFIAGYLHLHADIEKENENPLISCSVCVRRFSYFNNILWITEDPYSDLIARISEN